MSKQFKFIEGKELLEDSKLYKYSEIEKFGKRETGVADSYIRVMMWNNGDMIKLCQQRLMNTFNANDINEIKGNKIEKLKFDFDWEVGEVDSNGYVDSCNVVISCDDMLDDGELLGRVSSILDDKDLVNGWLDRGVKLSLTVNATKNYIDVGTVKIVGVGEDIDKSIINKLIGKILIDFSSVGIYPIALYQKTSDVRLAPMAYSRYSSNNNLEFYSNGILVTGVKNYTYDGLDSEAQYVARESVDKLEHNNALLELEGELEYRLEELGLDSGSFRYIGDGYLSKGDVSTYFPMVYPSDASRFFELVVAKGLEEEYEIEKNIDIIRYMIKKDFIGIKKDFNYCDVEIDVDRVVNSIIRDKRLISWVNVSELGLDSTAVSLGDAQKILEEELYVTFSELEGSVEGAANSVIGYLEKEFMNYFEDVLGKHDYDYYVTDYLYDEHGHIVKTLK